MPQAKNVIVAVPTSRIGAIAFAPALPEKIMAAEALPLGYAEKLYFALKDAEDVSRRSRRCTRIS